MTLILGVTLYTSRIVLDQLGVSDYGIYLQVGGIVTLLAFFRGAMATSTRRYFSIDIGRNDSIQLKKTFSAFLTIFFTLAVLVFIIAETIGLWYVQNKMVFPNERAHAVFVVYQFSVFTFLLSIIQVPYDALIQAKEKMKVFALVSLVETALKLISVFILVVVPIDKLIVYSFLTFLIAVLIRSIYMIYCNRYFKEAKFQFYFDGAYFKELLHYSAWNLFGSFATMARGQGNNLVLNLFFGPLVNAAFGLTSQVQQAVVMFVNNFQLALNPQIIATYAQNNVHQNHRLIKFGSKFSYYLLLLIVCPIYFNVEFVLIAWLGNVPLYTSVFVKLALICSLIDCISGPLMAGAQATGRIKGYQLAVGLTLFLNFPVSYILLKHFEMPPYVVYQVMIAFSVLALCLRILFLKHLIGFSVWSFVREVLVPILVVSIVVYYMNVSILVPMGAQFAWLTFFYNLLVSLFISISVIGLLGLSRTERSFLKNSVLMKFKGKINS